MEYPILKETKKQLSKGQSMTVSDAKGIMESNTDFKRETETRGIWE